MDIKDKIIYYSYEQLLYLELAVKLSKYNLTRKWIKIMFNTPKEPYTINSLYQIDKRLSSRFLYFELEKPKFMGIEFRNPYYVYNVNVR